MITIEQAKKFISIPEPTIEDCLAFLGLSKVSSLIEVRQHFKQLLIEHGSIKHSKEEQQQEEVAAVVVEAIVKAYKKLEESLPETTKLSKEEEELPVEPKPENNLNTIQEEKWASGFPGEDAAISVACQVLIELNEKNISWDIKASAKNDREILGICVYIKDPKDINEIVNVYGVLEKYGLLAMHNVDIRSLYQLKKNEGKLDKQQFAQAWEEAVNTLPTGAKISMPTHIKNQSILSDAELQFRDQIIMVLKEKLFANGDTNISKPGTIFTVTADLYKNINFMLLNIREITELEMLIVAKKILTTEAEKLKVKPVSGVSIFQPSPESQHLSDALRFLDDLIKSAREFRDNLNQKAANSAPVKKLNNS